MISGFSLDTTLDLHQKILPWNPCVARQDGRHVVFGEIVGDDSMAVVKKIEALQVSLV